MSETDALSTFDFSKVMKPGVWLKFVPGEPFTLRILTTDPLVTSESYEDKRTGETRVDTKFSFIVYNFTLDKAQVLKTTPKTAQRIAEIHLDDEYGADIRKVDVRITPPEKNEIKAYLVEVLQKTRTLTNDQIKEAQAISLEDLMPDGGRMSFYDKDKENRKQQETPGHDYAEEVAEGLKKDVEPTDEEIDINSIPF